MRATGEDYGDIIRALCPTGEAWPRDIPDLVRDQALDGMGETFARIHNLIEDMAREGSPRTALWLLGDWETSLALPDACLGPADTIAERQRRAHARLIDVGHTYRAYFVQLAAALGFAITIQEHPPATCESDCEASLDPDDLVVDGKPMPWCYVVTIRAPAETVFELDCETGGCDEPLRWWGNQTLECLIRRAMRRRRQTRHLYVRFAYGES